MLLAYLDSVGASGYAVDMCIEPWPGTAFVFREDPIGPERVKEVIERRFHASYQDCEGPVLAHLSSPP